MLTFACKKINFEELVRCSFALNKTEYKIFMYLLKRRKPKTAIKIAKDMKMDRTSIQKAVKSLFEKNLVERRQLNLNTGGYTYVYKTKEKEKIKKRMNKLVDEWAKKVRKKIANW